MLHIKFQGHRSVGSGGENFYMFLTYMGMAVILVPTICINIHSCVSINFHMKFGIKYINSF